MILACVPHGLLFVVIGLFVVFVAAGWWFLLGVMDDEREHGG